jgi:hemerythrin
MTAQVAAYCEKVRSDKASTPLQLMEFLKGWLNNHILHTDMDYSRCMQELALPTGWEEPPAR